MFSWGRNACIHCIDVFALFYTFYYDVFIKKINGVLTCVKFFQKEIYIFPFILNKKYCEKNFLGFVVIFILYFINNVLRIYENLGEFYQM